MEETNRYYVLASFALLTTHVLFSKKTNFNIIELRYAIYGVYLHMLLTNMQLFQSHCIRFSSFIANAIRNLR